MLGGMLTSDTNTWSPPEISPTTVRDQYLRLSCPLHMCLFTPQLVKLCSGMIEAGKAYVSANKLFVNGIRDLSQQCKKDEMISVRF